MEEKPVLSIADLNKTERIIDPNLEKALRNNNAISANANDEFNEVDPSTILPHVISDEPKKPNMMQSAMSDLDKALERKKNEAVEYFNRLEDNSRIIEDSLSDEELNKIEENGELIYNNGLSNMDEPKDTDRELTYLPENNNKNIQSIANLDMNDFDDLDSDFEDVESDQQSKDALKEFQKSISNKIKPITKKFDISSYTISKNVVHANSIQSAPLKVRTADWPLYNTGRLITMSSFTGSELDKLNSDQSSRNRLNASRDTYQILYDHDVTPNKPSDLDSWMKSISYLDANHLFGAVYAVNFSKVNYIPYDCPICKNMFLSEDIPFMDMVEFENSEAKSRFMKIYNKEIDLSSDGLYHIERIPISDNYAIDLKMPSLYNIVFETGSLNQEFVQKYSDIVTISSYIDDIYQIDHENRQLNKLEYRIYPNNMSKTTKSKIQAYATVLARLTPDQYSIVLSYLRQINEFSQDVHYVIPECTCPKCKNKISKVADRTMPDILFTRHQLAALATS